MRSNSARLLLIVFLTLAFAFLWAVSCSTQENKPSHPVESAEDVVPSGISAAIDGGGASDEEKPLSVIGADEEPADSQVADAALEGESVLKSELPAQPAETFESEAAPTNPSDPEVAANVGSESKSELEPKSESEREASPPRSGVGAASHESKAEDKIEIDSASGVGITTSVAHHSDYEASPVRESDDQAASAEPIIRIAAPEFTESRIYELGIPAIEKAFVFDLSAPVIETAEVVEDDFNFASRKLLILSIQNSSSEELGFIARKYSLSDSSASSILTSLGLSSEDVSRIKAAEGSNSDDKSDADGDVSDNRGPELTESDAKKLAEDLIPDKIPNDSIFMSKPDEVMLALRKAMLDMGFTQEDVGSLMASDQVVKRIGDFEKHLNQEDISFEESEDLADLIRDVISSDETDEADAYDEGSDSGSADGISSGADSESSSAAASKESDSVAESSGAKVSEPADSSVSSSYDFKVENADQVELYTISGKDMIRIGGNVQISFVLSGQTRTLKADHVLYDVSENEIIASGHISISSQSSDSKSLQDLAAESLSINLNDNKVRLSDAIGKTEKSNQSIHSSYYMSGKQLVLDSMTSEIYFDSGSLLPSSSPDKANWAISASKIIMRNNGDVLLSGLFFKIGRVPLVPRLPIIFILPGTPLVLNPAIGFSSSKGAFVNLTYEVFGKYSKIGNSGESGNSLTNLLKSDASGTLVKDGILYSYDNEGKSANPGSDYLVSFLDFYSEKGLFLGMEAKNTFFGKLNVTGKAGIAYMPQPKTGSIGSRSHKSFRYYFDIEDMSVSNIAGVNIKAKAPFYSDPDVGYDYQNRLTAFSIDSIFMKSPEFPSGVSSNATERRYQVSASYSKSFGLPALDSITADMNLDYSRYWAENGPNEYYSYASGEFTLPRVSLKASGTIFSFKKSDTSSVSVKRSINENFNELDESAKREQELLVMRDKVKFLNVIKVTDIETKVVPLSEYDASEKNADALVEDDAELFSDRSGFVHDPEKFSAHEDAFSRKGALGEKKDDESAADSSAVLDELASKRYSATAQISNSSSSLNSFFTGSHISLKYSLSDTFSNVFSKPSKRDRILGERKTSNSASGTITLEGGIGNNIFSFSEVLTPSYQYSFLESSANMVTREFSLRSSLSSSLNIPLSIPNINVSYSMSSVLYASKFANDDNAVEPSFTEKRIGWDSESISSHRVGLSMSFKSIVTAAVDTSLPPMESYTITPNLSFSMSGFGARVSHSLNGPNYSSLKSTKTSGSVSYSKDSFSTSFSVDYEYEKRSGNPGESLRPFNFSHNASISLLSSWLKLSESITFNGLTSSGQENYFSGMQFNVSVKEYFSAGFTVMGPYDNLELSKTVFKINVPEFNITFWKNRIVLSLGFTTTANVDFRDAFLNSLSYSFSLGFNIREFISISVSLGGSNNNFLKYTGNNRVGRFDFGAFVSDIFRGINFFSPDMASSNFKLDRLTVKLEHDMGDFLLTFSFTGKFELNVNEYEWKPEYSILLKWGVIPELKVDKTLKP